MAHIKTPENPENLTDSERKHIPFISVQGNEVTVVCGDGIVHPMEEDHYIIYIELFQDGESLERKKLSPSDEPKAVFSVENPENLSAHAFCNLHGIWASL
jgi:superoxide reductase